MNETPDPLETELHGLRPREPSAELRRRIADSLALPARLRPRRRWRGAIWGAVLTGGLAAACLAVAFLPRPETDVVTEPEPPSESPRPLLAAAFDDSLPTVWTYRRALARSMNELDAALDRHMGPVKEPASPLSHVRAFARLKDPHSLPGEL